ncbi:Sugar (pentulose or hexulose) kinase [Loktanella fryxellensis]|uniref:Sugar (Pentulose or hexulose) kinase n=1 Tax=Loktanella fryxellensis TaxID=245187 RepID=A0A1H8F335_9RHOB|nr:FGGY-family carbohydrate kinase [Loktanella fryxellensis]SEN25408.1 Sugar (pentulose or hexulose) kinase [Loktanella fryxellensis]
MKHVAVIDIGKTNVKLALVDLVTGAEVAVVTRPNAVRVAPPYPHFDVEGYWDFLLDALATFHATHGVDGISVTTHGACAALLDAGGALATPVLDYEHDGPDAVATAYDAIRPAFASTGSPRLPGGLNVGAQLHWLFGRDPGLLARTAHVVTWPQYWGFRLTGQLATDVTSLGCHTDLWCPDAGTFSTLVDTLGVRDKIAAPRRPDEVLGTLTAAVAARTGLPAQTPVTVGIHDSNASLLPHLMRRTAPFTVVSTGTWVIALAVGGEEVALDPARDTLVNVAADGRPVRSARFMGGRTFDMLTAGRAVTPTPADEAAVLAEGIMLLPSVVAGSGPFPQRAPAWTGAAPATGSGPHAAATAFHLALMTATCLSLIGAQGPTIVEGAFARNATYLRMLAAATGRSVIAAPSSTGTSLGAALLMGDTATPPAADAVITTPGPDWAAYATRWRVAVAG